ncbi:MAG: hypothetical protein N2689_15685, partial [Verrucomicrobiae bacterium]|nr:hypothetical protein [Verrucomicrobiae bacterium]
MAWRIMPSAFQGAVLLAGRRRLFQTDLAEVFFRATLHGFDGDALAALAREHDDRRLQGLRQAPDLREHGQTVVVGQMVSSR